MFIFFKNVFMFSKNIHMFSSKHVDVCILFATKFFYHTTPCAIIALATFMKPATFAPFT